MKPIFTHFLATAVGVVAILLFQQSREKQAAAANAAHKQVGTDLAGSKHFDPSARPPGRHKPRPDHDETDGVWLKEPSRADLEQWLAHLKGNPRSLAEAQATVGLLTNNPDLVRKALEADPNNPQLQFIGATFSSFPDEERLALAERFFKQDTDNGMAAYLYSSQLLKSGDPKAALEILRSATDRGKMDDFQKRMSFSFEDAIAGAGVSRDDAKLLSAFSLPMSHLSDFTSFAGSLNDMAKTLPMEEASEIGSLAASMGRRVGEQAEPKSFVSTLVGLSLEEKTLAGLPDDAPSPYQGLTVAEARESIAIERKNIKRTLKEIPDYETLFQSNPELKSGFVDRFRMLGEAEATNWLIQQTKK